MEKDEQRWDKIHKRDDYDEKKREYHQQVLLDNKRNTHGYLVPNPGWPTTPSPSSTTPPRWATT